jgi:hypothetical protein
MRSPFHDGSSRRLSFAGRLLHFSVTEKSAADAGGNPRLRLLARVLVRSATSAYAPRNTVLRLDRPGGFEVTELTQPLAAAPTETIAAGPPQVVESHSTSFSELASQPVP